MWVELPVNDQQIRIGREQAIFAHPPALAELVEFRIGGLFVEPAFRRLTTRDGRVIVIEPLVMQVFVMLAESAGQPVSRDQLIARCWGRRIVGDDAINRVISRLRRDLADSDEPGLEVETISKVGYVLRIDGAAPSDVAAAEPEATTARPASTSRRLIKSAIGLACAAMTAGGLAYWQAPGTDGSIVIAIKPAANVPGDRETAQFASDVTADVARLASSVTRVVFLGPAASDAGADMVVRVSVSGAADGSASRVSLTDRHNGLVVWSSDFREDKLAGLGVRETTALGIAAVVHCSLERTGTGFENPVNMRLYFSACDAAQKRDWPRARSFAQQIVARWPEKATGWACLAMTTVHEAMSNPRVRHEASLRAIAYANRAIKIDPGSGLASQALAMALALDGRPDLPALQRGIAIDPDHAGLQARYAQSLLKLGYVQAAVEPAQRAAALEPTTPEFEEGAVDALLAVGRTPEALARQLELEGSWRMTPQVRYQSVSMLRFGRNPAAALKNLQARPSADDAMNALTQIELRWKVDPARFDWGAFDRDAERVFASGAYNAWSLAALAARMNESARAFRWLDRAVAASPSAGWTPIFWPEAAALRRDPRFFEAMFRIGLVAHWTRSGRWPDFCSEPGLAYDCRAEAKRLANGATVAA